MIEVDLSRMTINRGWDCRISELALEESSPEADNMYESQTRTKLTDPASNWASGFERLVDICEFDVINVIRQMSYGLITMSIIHVGARCQTGTCKHGGNPDVNNIGLP
jgi:hypothetical protein